MNKLRRRLILNFSLQFISIAILMVLVIAITFILVLVWFTTDQSEHHSHQAKLEEVVMNTGDSFKELIIPEDWDQTFEEDNIWVQILDENGDVFEEGNVPNHFPNSYSNLDLLEMKEKMEYNGYSLLFYLETFHEEDYLYILGYESEGHILLQNLVETYKEHGVIPHQSMADVNEKLQEVDATLQIFNRNHELEQSLGKPIEEEDTPLDVFGRDMSPDIYTTEQHTYRDQDSGAFWILNIPNENKQEVRLKMYEETLVVLGITTLIVLVITLIISVWNGIRYGNPLFIFANWLSRMGNGQYEEVLTEREKKQVYRKNGKLKWRYRLYREVFDNFYDMAEKLDASRKEREQLEKTREEWMAGISHDLRTPLTTMEGYGRLLESGEYEWSKDELVDIGKTIHEKSDYMVRLIEDFNLSFQLKNDATKLSFHQVEMNCFLQRILKKFTNDMTLQEYEITFEPTNREVFLTINERLFERMMDNLIYNAIKHNPPGTTIMVHLEKGQGLHISVKDNGVGIDEENIKHLFSRYYRGINTDERIEGTGLGMSIALQIAKLHQGTIKVESEKSIGTTVRLEF